MKRLVRILLVFILVLSMGTAAMAKPSAGGGKGNANGKNSPSTNSSTKGNTSSASLNLELANETTSEQPTDGQPGDSMAEDEAIQEDTEGEQPAETVNEKKAQIRQHKIEKRREQLTKALEKLGEKQEKIQIILSENQPVAGELLVNGKQPKFELPPVIKQGRTLIPVRAITQGLGAELSWDAENQKVTIVRGEVTIELAIGSNEATVNGEAIMIEMPASLISNRTFVPLRFISEILGEKVDYDPETGDINIGDGAEEGSTEEPVDDETTEPTDDPAADPDAGETNNFQ